MAGQLAVAAIKCRGLLHLSWALSSVCCSLDPLRRQGHGGGGALVSGDTVMAWQTGQESNPGSE